ncbi:MAG TPA: EamA family transporter [Pyrinomonadaceae bacterium]|nr:EamA family transporter [Pyrinomonadaceae bacterium]
MRQTPRRGGEQAITAAPSKASAVAVWLLLCLIWGSTWSFIKLGLRDLPPLTFVALRFAIAVAVLLAVAHFRRARWPRTRAEWGLLATTGVLAFTVNYGLIFWGEQYVSSGLAALLQATIPLFGLLLAHKVLPGEPLTAARLLGVAVGLVGVALIFSDQLYVGDARAVRGGGAIVLGALAAAYSNVLVKARAADFDISVLAAGQMLCGLVPVIILGLAREGNPLHLRWTTTAIVSVLYLALVGSVVAFMLYYWLVRNMDVTNTQMIALVTPAVAVLVGVLFLGETLTWRIALGGLAIFAGVAVAVLRRRGPPRVRQETVGG